MTGTNGTKSLGNTKPSSKGRNYCFTVNNWTEEELEQMTRGFEVSGCKWVIGKEVGESGTKHLQGAVFYKNPRSFEAVKKELPRAHIEKCKGTWEQNYEYCTKDKDILTNWEKEKSIDELILEEEYKDVVWKDWQKDIIDLVEQKPDARAIHWITDRVGNSGKSFLCKYLGLKYDVIVASGKTGDIFNQMRGWREGNPTKLRPDIILVDVPRHEYSHVNYAAIEAVKNGYLYSGKYEGGVIKLTRPHVVIFANEEPDIQAMSGDRWRITVL